MKLLSPYPFSYYTHICMFSKATYVQRRKTLMDTVKSGLILLLGNDESSMNYRDNTYPFRQDSTFLYYFGLDRAGLCATLDTDSGEVAIYGNEYTIDDMVWMGSLDSIKTQAAAIGVSTVKPLSELKKDIKNTPTHILPSYRADHTLQYAGLFDCYPSEVKNKVSETLCLAVANQRNYKSEEEIVEINKAVDTSVQMHKMAIRLAKPGVKEREVFAALEQIAVENGCGTSFPTIATINGQTLHNHHYGNTLSEGDLFLIDAGAQSWSGYAGDLSSTIPVSGKFSAKQLDIYNLALASHKKAVAMLKPGTSFKEIYYESARVIVEGMKDLGLMKGDTDNALENGAHAMFFPCGLGHMMGMDVHDMENIGESIVGYGGAKKSTQFGVKSLRLGRKLEPGFVLTIEPGIYFIPELIDLWQKEKVNTDFFNFDRLNSYRDFGGIRNEEDYLITADGHQRMGSIKKPIEVDEVYEEWHKNPSDL